MLHLLFEVHSEGTSRHSGQPSAEWQYRNCHKRPSSYCRHQRYNPARKL